MNLGELSLIRSVPEQNLTPSPPFYKPSAIERWVFTMRFLAISIAISAVVIGHRTLSFHNAFFCNLHRYLCSCCYTISFRIAKAAWGTTSRTWDFGSTSRGYYVGHYAGHTSWPWLRPPWTCKTRSVLWPVEWRPASKCQKMELW